ncbi:MAG: hypothetical protein ACLPLZ_00255 [Terracidiphilus sp.]
MTRFTTLALTVAVAVSATGLIYAQPPDHRSYTQSEIKQMIRDAHTAQQYHDLATYFQGRQQYFEQQAQSEKIEWDRRSQITAASYQKYPRPADSSRNRYEYFTYEARQMASQADHFDILSARSQ